MPSGVSESGDVVAKVRALLERAAHPSTPEEEARTSAFIAARLIKANALEVTLPAVVPASAAPPAPPGDASSRATHDGPFRAARTTRRRRRRPVPEDPSWVLVLSMYRGRCKACRRFYEQGDEVCWRPGSGRTHFACRGYWDDSDL